MNEPFIPPPPVPSRASSAFTWGYQCGQKAALREATFYAQARALFPSHDEFTQADQGFKEARTDARKEAYSVART